MKRAELFLEHLKEMWIPYTVGVLFIIGLVSIFLSLYIVQNKHYTAKITGIRGCSVITEVTDKISCCSGSLFTSSNYCSLGDTIDFSCSRNLLNEIFCGRATVVQEASK